MKKRELDLLHGDIFPTILRLSGPLLAQGVLITAYNLCDMLWLGLLSADSVSAAGIAGMFLWFASGVSILNRTGTQIKVGQRLGAGQKENARSYAAAGFQLATIEAVLLTILTLLMSKQLIAFFRLPSQTMIEDAGKYLVITVGFSIFSYWNTMCSGIHNAMGDSKTPFMVNFVGLIINIVLDPLMIFGYLGCPAMGIVGAAWATIIAQGIASLLNFAVAYKNPFFRESPFWKIQAKERYLSITKLGLPTGMEAIAFSVITMILSRQISSFGNAAIAAQKVGTQIESITYMAAEGFAAAGNAFIAQNFGAGEVERIREGNRCIRRIGIVWGSICTVLMLIFPKELFSLFIHEPEIIPYGADYLRILGFSQLFNVLEYTSGGVFNGLGHTTPPSLVGIGLTAARIPVAAVLSSYWGIDGIWWTCSLSASLKGLVLTVWLLLSLNKILDREIVQVRRMV